MINTARLMATLPWRALAAAEPVDRDHVVEIIAGFDQLPVQADGSIKRRKPAELVAGRDEALKQIEKLRGLIKLYKLNDRPVTVDTERGIVNMTPDEMLHWMQHGLDILEPAPHPAPNIGPDQWSTAAARLMFLELQDAGAVDWRNVSNREQALFLCTALAELADHHGQPRPTMTAERWRKSRDAWLQRHPSGIWSLKTNAA